MFDSILIIILFLAIGFVIGYWPVNTRQTKYEATGRKCEPVTFPKYNHNRLGGENKPMTKDKAMEIAVTHIKQFNELIKGRK